MTRATVKDAEPASVPGRWRYHVGDPGYWIVERYRHTLSRLCPGLRSAADICYFSQAGINVRRQLRQVKPSCPVAMGACVKMADARGEAKEGRCRRKPGPDADGRG